MKRSIHSSESILCSVWICLNFTFLRIQIGRKYDRMRERVAWCSVLTYRIPFALPHTSTSHTHSKTHTHTHARTHAHFHPVYFHTHITTSLRHSISLSLSLSFSHSHTRTHTHYYIPHLLKEAGSHTLSLSYTHSLASPIVSFSLMSHFEIYANTNVFHISSDQINNTIFHVVLIHWVYFVIGQ